MRTCHAFAPATDRTALLGKTRIDDTGIGIIAARTSHTIRVLGRKRWIPGPLATVIDAPVDQVHGRTMIWPARIDAEPLRRISASTYQVWSAAPR